MEEIAKIHRSLDPQILRSSDPQIEGSVYLLEILRSWDSGYSYIKVNTVVCMW